MALKVLDLLTQTAGMSYKRMLFALLFSSALSIYIFVVYRAMSKESFYSKSFNMTLPIITVLTTAIVVAMQANLVVSLGMVGALSIVRFRTALKDPLDLAFVFWSISMGIISGTEIYGLALLTSAITTIGLFALDGVRMKEAPHLLIINGRNAEYEKQVDDILKKTTSYYAVKSRNINKNTLDLVYEIKTSQDQELVFEINKLEDVETASILNHDGSMRH